MHKKTKKMITLPLNSLPKKILIVEDEPALSNALSLKLQSENYTTEVAENGEIALSMLTKDEYSLVLLDLLMPIMDGFEVMDHFQKIDHPPFIVLSNLGQDEDIKKAKQSGAIEVFTKSNVQIAKIIEFINELNL